MPKACLFPHAIRHCRRELSAGQICSSLADDYVAKAFSSPELQLICWKRVHLRAEVAGHGHV